MAAIVALVATIAIWLLLMPLVPAIASVTLRRFHLRTDSFVAWAVQFPIPAMYNFANRFEVRDSVADPSGDAMEDSAAPTRRMVNHFPSRIFTFGDGRYLHLRHGEDRWLTIESSYRGQTLRSQFHAEALPGGGFKLHRLDSAEKIR